MACGTGARDTTHMDYESNVTTISLTVPRTARYARMGPEGGTVEQVWLVCHGYGQLASRFIRRFSAIDDGSRLIIAPEALSRFYLSAASGGYSPGDKVGASWMTGEGRDAEIIDQTRYLDMVCARVFEGVDRPSVRFVALGFSQGTATICRWAAQTAAPPDHLILWGGGVPSELLGGTSVSGLARASLTIVVGDQDAIAHGEHVASHRAQLAGAKLSYRFITYAGGHDINPDVLAGVANEIRSENGGSGASTL